MREIRSRRGRRGRAGLQADFPPDDPRFWRKLKAGARLTVGPPQSEPRPAAGRLELEITGVRAVAVQDARGGLLLEYLLLDLGGPGVWSLLAVVVAGGNLSIRIASPLEDGSAASREELAERLPWLYERGAEGPAYARCPAMPAGRAPGATFAAALAAPLRGDYAVAGSDRAASLLIMEYAALEPCEEPFLIILEDLESGRVTALAAASLEPAQFRT